MVAGAKNDSVRVFVDPTSPNLASQTPYLIATVTVGGTENDPTGLSGLLITQFGSASQVSVGGAIGRAAVGDSFSDVAGAIGVVPEPATPALLALGLLVWRILSRRS